MKPIIIILSIIIINGRGLLGNVILGLVIGWVNTIRTVSIITNGRSSRYPSGTLSLM